MSKFKGKVGIAAVVAVSVLVLLIYVLVVLPLDKQIRAGARSDVSRGAQLVKGWLNQHGYDLVAVARDGANREAFVKAIQVEDASKRRQEVFDAISVYDDQLKTRRRKADFLGVVDEQGKIIARDLNIQDMFGEKLPYGAINHALAGRATSDVWVMKNRMMRAAAAPIYVNGEAKGALVIAYDLTDAEANAEHRMANAHVVYFNSGAVRAASFPKAGAEVKAVNTALLKEGTEVTKAVAAGKLSDLFVAEIDGQKYVGMAGPLAPPVTVEGGKTKPGAAMHQTSAAQQHGAGFIVLANTTRRLARVTTIRWASLGFLALLMLFILAVMWGVAKQYIDAQDRLELGVSEVISGNTEYTFETQGKLAAVAQQLNIMLARLLGRPEPSKSTFSVGGGMGNIVAVGAAVALVTLFYLVVALPLAKDGRQGASGDVERGGDLVQGWVRLHAFQLVAQARRGANDDALSAALASEDAAKRAQDVQSALTAFEAKVATKRGKRDVLAVVDLQGKVIAPKETAGQALTLGAVTHALAGRATSDVWVLGDRLVRGAAAPVYVNGEVKGALVVGYAIKDAEAKGEHEMANSQVAYLSGGVVRAGSLKVGVEAVKDEVGKAVAAGKVSKVFTTKIGGAQYVGVAGPLPAPVTIYGGKSTAGGELSKNAADAQGAGFVVLAALAPRLAGVTTARWVLLGFLVMLVVFVLALMWGVARHFVNAQRTLETGINEVTAGNMEYTFDALEEFEGLANALNVMLARLLGRPEPGEEEDGDQAWRADVITLDALAQPSGEEAQLGSESEEQYFARLFEEYVAARKAAELSVEGITAAVFAQRVKANQAMLRAKHDCKNVRCTVCSASGRVTLRPLRLG